MRVGIPWRDLAIELGQLPLRERRPASCKFTHICTLRYAAVCSSAKETERHLSRNEPSCVAVIPSKTLEQYRDPGYNILHIDRA